MDRAEIFLKAMELVHTIRPELVIWDEVIEATEIIADAAINYAEGDGMNNHT